MTLTIYMNSIFNPLLYIIRNTKYRKELLILKTNTMRFLGCGRVRNGEQCGRKVGSLKSSNGFRPAEISNVSRSAATRVELELEK